MADSIEKSSPSSNEGDKSFLQSFRSLSEKDTLLRDNARLEHVSQQSLTVCMNVRQSLQGLFCKGKDDDRETDVTYHSDDFVSDFNRSNDSSVGIYDGVTRFLKAEHVRLINMLECLSNPALHGASRNQDTSSCDGHSGKAHGLKSLANKRGYLPLFPELPDCLTRAFTGSSPNNASLVLEVEKAVSQLEGTQLAMSKACEKAHSTCEEYRPIVESLSQAKNEDMLLPEIQEKLNIVADQVMAALEMDNDLPPSKARSDKWRDDVFHSWNMFQLKHY